MKLAFLMGAILSIALVTAVPQLPTGYFGIVTDESGSPVEGIEVIVKDASGNIVGISKSTNNEGHYIVNALWDDSGTDYDEGVSLGEQIKFYVEGIFVATATIGEQGANNELNLEYNLPSSQNTVSSPSGTNIIVEPVISKEVNVTKLNITNVTNNNSDITTIDLNQTVIVKPPTGEQPYEEESEKKLQPIIFWIIGGLVLLIGIIFMIKKRD